MNSPVGMKYMFATLCSNPAATKAAMGGTEALSARRQSLPTRSRPPAGDTL